MKACVLHAVGDLRCETVDAPVPKPGEALVRVRACGVCGSDIPRVFVKGTYSFPLIPGHEFAGEIAAVGDGVDAGRIGQRVAVFPLKPCMKCPLCRIGHYAQCQDYDYLGSRCDGAFAEYATAPEWNLLPMPDSVSMEKAAMAEPAAVALHAVRLSGLSAGDSILIFGAGPIGLLAAAWARAAGARAVLLADIDPVRLDAAAAYGFPVSYNPKDGGLADWVKQQTGAGADVVLEASGASPAFEQAMYCARPLGSVVLLGNPMGEMKLSQQGYWQILRKQLRLTGSWNSEYGAFPVNEWHLALDAIAAHRIDVIPLITHRVGLEQLPDALLMMRDRTEPSGKVMCVNNG